MFFSSSSKNASTPSSSSKRDSLPKPSNVDLEAQEDCTDMVDDFFGVTYSKEERRARPQAAVALLAMPEPALTTSVARLPTHRDSVQVEDDSSDAVLDFFGIAETREERRARLDVDHERAQAAAPATHASRHDARLSISSIPPPYDLEAQSDCDTMVADLPSYETASSTKEASSTEPNTIPAALYKWGFYCPLLWPLGACLLVNFHSPMELARLYGPEESPARVRILRAAELRWAKRCLLATIILTFFILMVVGMTVGIILSIRG